MTGAWPKWVAAGAAASGVIALYASLGAVFTSGSQVAGGPATLAAFGVFMAWLLAFSIYLLLPRKG